MKLKHLTKLLPMLLLLPVHFAQAAGPDDGEELGQEQRRIQELVRDNEDRIIFHVHMQPVYAKFDQLRQRGIHVDDAQERSNWVRQNKLFFVEQAAGGQINPPSEDILDLFFPLHDAGIDIRNDVINDQVHKAIMVEVSKPDFMETQGNYTKELMLSEFGVTPPLGIPAYNDQYHFPENVQHGNVDQDQGPMPD